MRFDGRTRVYISQRDAPELCMSLSPSGGRGECRAPVAPAASCAHRIVQSAHEYSQRSHRKSPGIPARNGFNGFLRALPGDRAFLSPSSRGYGTSARSGSRTSAGLDAGVEASGPHDFAVRFSAVRLRAQGSAHGNRPAITAARGHCRVHRIPSRVRDDRDTPLCGTGRLGI
jgi:hypothetical protein